MAQHPLALCFVTNELYPFTGGGLGRLLYNIFKTWISPEVQCHVLVPISHRNKIDKAGIQSNFGKNFDVHYVSFEGTHTIGLQDDLLFGPSWSFSHTEHFGISYSIYRKLSELSKLNGIQFDYIEFPDIFGWSYCTMQSRLLGDDFAHTKIAVRLHSTVGIIGDIEGTIHDWGRLGTAELERKALQDADVIVAHLYDVAEFNRKFYGFDGAWLSKVFIERPPILLDGLYSANKTSSEIRDIGFVGRLQHIKGPSTFIKGCELFVYNNSEYSGTIIFSCHEQDTSLLELQLNTVDTKVRTRFLQDQSARSAIIQNGIVPITSHHESYCLAAYETSLLGGILVLNERCVAFNENSGWRDDVNCIKFDGTAQGLAKSLERAYQTSSLQNYSPAIGTPYWNKRSSKGRKAAKKATTNPTIGIIVISSSLKDDISGTLDSLKVGENYNIDVVICSDLLDDSLNHPGRAFQVSSVTFPRGATEGVMLNAAVDKIAGDYLLFLHAGDRLSPSYLSRAVRCLETQQAYDGVVPQAAVYEATNDGQIDQLHTWTTFLGESIALSLVRNSIAGPGGYLLRRSALGGVRFDERNVGVQHWRLLAQLTAAGSKLVVTNTTDLYWQSAESHFAWNDKPHLAKIERGIALDSIDLKEMILPKYAFRAFQSEMVSEQISWELTTKQKRPTHKRILREFGRVTRRLKERWNRA